MTPLLSFADVELAQLIATAALLPVEQRADFVQQVAAGLAASATFLAAVAAAQRGGLGSRRPARAVLEQTP